MELRVPDVCPQLPDARPPHAAQPGQVPTEWNVRSHPIPRYHAHPLVCITRDQVPTEWNVRSHPIPCYHAHLLVCITRDRRMECMFKPNSMLSCSYLGLYYTRLKMRLKTGDEK